MSAASLESLTNELFEQVVQHLQSLDDIRNLRLASRSIAFKAAQDTYRAFFRKKHVDITRDGLEAFDHATSQGGIGCLVEDLTLVGIVHNPKELQNLIKTGVKYSRPKRALLSRKVKETYATPGELEAARQDLATLERRRKEGEALRSEGNDVTMLSEAFSNIVSSNKSTLKSLTLRTKTHRGHSLPKRWRSARAERSKAGFQIATSTFWLAMDSLFNSHLRLQTLDIFFAWHEQLECSLPCDALGNLDFTSGGIGPCLCTLKVLSVSITDPIVKETKYEVLCSSEDEDGVVSASEQQTSAAALSRNTIADEKNYSAISNMVDLCRGLEELNIVGYQLKCSDEPLQELQKTMRRQHLHHLARGIHLPQLRRLNFSSLEVQDNDILTFLIKHNSSLRELELTMITLPEGSFSPLVRYVTGDGNELEAIWFDDIHEGHELIHFQCDWDREGVDVGDRDFVRVHGPERKSDISYFGRDVGMMGYPMRWQWTLEQQQIQEDEELDVDFSRCQCHR